MVLRRFASRFKAVRAAFLARIEGIARAEDREQYAALMLKRLMLIFFLQQKGCLAISRLGVLDGDLDYLPNRLRACDVSEAAYTFYRPFLLKLFHEGLGVHRHTPELEALCGKLPSFEFSLFHKHELERIYPAIDIPDEAFAQLFAFFTEFSWQCEESFPRRKNEVTPDILDILLEIKEHQKHLGSYYTQADVTTYISTNTIIPWLFAEMESACPELFAPGGTAWELLRAHPERYFYRAFRHGCEVELPPEIAAGLHSLAHRAAWDRPAPAEYALPLECWREVVTRRQRYTEILARIRASEICSLVHCITENLDLRQLCLDVIERCDDARQLVAFYDCLAQMSVLDPTCGSGAFLLAALNVLEPLYEACLEHIQLVLAQDSGRRKIAGASGERLRALLQQAKQHSNRSYFVRKTIIERNLYGVDIVPEAVEMCSLRLLLQVIAHAESCADIEALSVNDLHIRAGNALIGFVVSDDCGARASTADSYAARLDGQLAAEYGIDQRSARRNLAAQLQAWKRSHRPFHWCVEFQQVMQRGGFDVIIGNPPYVAYSKVKATYQVRSYETRKCGNLCAYTLERASALLRPGGRCGMIAPVSTISAESYRPLGRLLLERQLWISSYSNRPAKLFANVEQRLAIILMCNAVPRALFASAYRHWYEAERGHLFATLAYSAASTWSPTGMPLKSGSERAEVIFSRFGNRRDFPLLACRQARAAVWVHNAPTYWVRALPFEPNSGERNQRSKHYRKIEVESQVEAYILAAILSSSTFYFFYKMVSNCRDLGLKELRLFPLGDLAPGLAARLADLGEQLGLRLKETSLRCTRHYPSGTSVYEEYYPARAKALLDEIDRVLAEHYGFTSEELDFILHCDLKYRMGDAM